MSVYKHNRGFSPVLVILIVFIVFALVVYILLSSADVGVETKDGVGNGVYDGTVSWVFDVNKGGWSSVGVPPDCPKPLVFPSPADVNLASGVLYPGQIRGTDYKPHGGLRFDDLLSNRVDVYAPMDGVLYKAARHLESGEIQYALYFINDCGIMYKLDHLRELTAKFEKVLDTIPQGGEGDSRTTEIKPGVFVAEGEHVATKIGLESSKNIFFDFGVYDLRKTSGGKENDEYRPYGICWLENLEEPDRSVVKSLPGVDTTSGSNSDYCK